MRKSNVMQSTEASRERSKRRPAVNENENFSNEKEVKKSSVRRRGQQSMLTDGQVRAFESNSLKFSEFYQLFQLLVIRCMRTWWTNVLSWCNNNFCWSTEVRVFDIQLSTTDFSVFFSAAYLYIRCTRRSEMFSCDDATTISTGRLKFVRLIYI